VASSLNPEPRTLTPHLKLLDLGLARLQSNQPPGEELTARGQTMGTLDYMAPEQASDTHTVDIRADIYSLGCTLYCLLTGHPPFRGPQYDSPIKKIMAHAQSPIPPIGAVPADVPSELVAVVNRLMAKNPADRFAVPADVAAALQPLARGSDLAALAARASSEAPVRQPTTVSFTRAPLPQPSPLGAEGRVEGLVSRSRRPLPLSILVGLAAAAVLLAIAGVVVRITTPHGTLVLEFPDGVATDLEVSWTGARSRCAASMAKQSHSASAGTPSP
jgi:serine/threonine protein kinase